MRCRSGRLQCAGRRAKRVVDAHAKRDIIARTDRAKKLRSGNCSGSACGSCGSLHLRARFTGYPFRVFDLTLRLLFLLRSRPLNSSPLLCSSVSPRPAALVGPRQYRLGKNRHHTPGRHEALRAVLMSGQFLRRGRGFGGCAPCPSLRLMLFRRFRRFAGARINSPQSPIANARSTPDGSEDFCCARGISV